MDFFENVGRNILVVLKQQGSSQSSLAEKIGVSRQVMQKIIKGKKAINALEISKIAEVLGVSVETLTQETTKTQEEDQVVMFMGSIKNEHVKEKFDFLNVIMEEIVHMEDDLNE
ncbi:helix-turn-helix domain-containing protein [Aneurinibacillus aneurinilyticus]|jgi:transcriptional regulator with XRE-family HTH domain|uniref:helix-turn-helix domain-containing protein n=1 Tax=Aneurinibacillus aneurinilyticus TaxID=1391 RepID=UPI0023F908CE|nr:helix-turn-helix transcriptional regulator [Aneurinibacillus aneurinilyticus]MCI1693311.1 helix-turn-helix domain-containing protein [Aneurinibacillus aneurinilyticus]